MRSKVDQIEKEESLQQLSMMAMQEGIFELQQGLDQTELSLEAVNSNINKSAHQM